MFQSYILTIIRYKTTGTEGKALQKRHPLHNPSAEYALDIILKRGIIRNNKNRKISGLFPQTVY
jgi:hypothetical protein